MSDEIDDFDLADEETAKEQRQLGLVIPTLEAGMSLSDAEERFRKAKTPFPVSFVSEDEKTGEEIFDTAAEGEKWRCTMNWPCVPSVSEAEQWQRRQVALYERAQWLREFGGKKSDA